VLCVDDEPQLVQTIALDVSRAGFRVAVAENGVAGLGAFLRLKEEVCLVVTDIIMPVMNGIDMAQRIVWFEPHAKILLMSAYSDDETGRRRSHNRFPFLRKPFKLATLIEKIQAIVGAPQVSASSR
jgi:CheY-like chemotaxis protein